MLGRHASRPRGRSQNLLLFRRCRHLADRVRSCDVPRETDVVDRVVVAEDAVMLRRVAGGRVRLSVAASGDSGGDGAQGGNEFFPESQRSDEHDRAVVDDGAGGYRAGGGFVGVPTPENGAAAAAGRSVFD